MLDKYCILGLIALASTALSAATRAGEHAKVAVVKTGTSVSTVLEAPKSQILSARLTVTGPGGGVVYQEQGVTDVLLWQPSLDAKNGQYTWEAVYLLPDASNPVVRESSGRKMIRENGTVKLRNGLIEEAAQPEARIRSRPPGLLERLLGSVLTAMTSPAAAEIDHNQIVDINEADPQIRFNDQGDSLDGFSWILFATENDFTIKDDAGSDKPLVFQIDANPGSLANQALYIANDGELGSGTSTPNAHLHLLDNQLPDIRLDDGTNAFEIELESDGNYAVKDIDDGTTPFRIESGAPTGAFHMDDNGNIGIGTNVPGSAQFTLVDPSPAISFVDTDTGERNVRLDASQSQFRIRKRTGAPLDTSVAMFDMAAPALSLVIDSAGYTGLGTALPDKQLHVLGEDSNQLGQNNVMLQVENIVGDQGPRRMIELINNGSPLLVYKDTARGTVWNMSPVGNSFAISLSGTGAQEFLMDGDGNVTIQGALTQNSARAEKAGIAPVDTDTVLAKLDRLSIEEWSYEHSPDSRHLGPMAGTFHAVFGLGPDDAIAPSDVAGVALAAAKALKAENDALAAQNERLKARLEAQISNQASQFQELETRIRAILSKLEGANPGGRR